jgi:pyruvate/2-oxoglutarate dehydrogenase complex dihydrolipoamide acyltransferase (E2) component
VEVVFAANPAQADDLIRRRLRKAKPGLVLVTNDEALVREAAAYGVAVWRGDEFVQRMQVKAAPAVEAGTEEHVQVSKAEVEEWLALFRARYLARKAARDARRVNGTSPVGSSPKPTVKPQTNAKPKGNASAQKPPPVAKKGKARRSGSQNHDR